MRILPMNRITLLPKNTEAKHPSKTWRGPASIAIVSRGPTLRRSIRQRTSWSEHFRLVSGVIHPLTTIGRATERILRLNLETRIEIREILLVVGRYPGNPEY